jgi:hypothetical protein
MIYSGSYRRTPSTPSWPHKHHAPASSHPSQHCGYARCSAVHLYTPSQSGGHPPPSTQLYPRSRNEGIQDTSKNLSTQVAHTTQLVPGGLIRSPETDEHAPDTTVLEPYTPGQPPHPSSGPPLTTSALPTYLWCVMTCVHWPELGGRAIRVALCGRPSRSAQTRERSHDSCSHARDARGGSGAARISPGQGAESQPW